MEVGMGNVPATSQTPDVEAGPRPQNMSGEVRLVMGLLSLTVRTQVPALSSLPTQSSCQVEWAETVAAVARRTVAYFMLDVDGVRCEMSEGYEALYRRFLDQTPAGTPSIYSLLILRVMRLRTVYRGNLRATT